MTFRYRKSINLGGGVRLNLSKTGVGLSCGVPGLRYSVHSSGRRTRTVGIPGTGMYWRDDHRTHYVAPASSAARTRRPTQPGTRPNAEPKPLPHRHKPGLFAPRGERQLFEAIDRADAAAMDKVAWDHPELRLAAETLSGLHRTTSDPTGARQLLAQVFATGGDPAADPFIQAYAGEPFHVKVQVVPGVVAELPIGREAVGLVLAELDHRAGDLDAGIAALEQLALDGHVRVALADLYAAAGRDGDVVRLTDGITNTDEVGALLCLLRGVALRHAGHTLAARDALTEAARVRSRDASIRVRAFFERGQCWLAEGQRARAKQDFERVLSKDSSFPGLQEALASVQAK
jgi:hypothetical protein